MILSKKVAVIAISFLSFSISQLIGQNQRIIENNAFKVGEKLTFSIGWEFINAGTAILNVEKIVSINNSRCYHISAVTNSNAFFSTLYKVRDRLESYVDVNGIYPLRYIKKTYEGGYERNFTVNFHHESQRALISDADSGNSEINIPQYLQDIISSFYFVRTQPMVEGRDIQLYVFDNGRYKDVTVKVIKKERISVNAGEFDCILVQTPIGPFSNKSDLNIWLTDDVRRIPVLMKSKIIIGSVRAELESFSAE
ncbi:DUF3108 domain-containing protein [bacterium]|nr:DUF3108 domain-containing protein [bacterium]